jgi:cAMP-specific phosphodiesterase 4
MAQNTESDMLALQLQEQSSERGHGLPRVPRSPNSLSRERLVAHVLKLLTRMGASRVVGANAPKLRRFVEEASLLYRRNPYHHWHHAADVTHMVAWLATRPVFRASFDPADVFWLLIAAIVHDVDHPGHNNQWEISSKTARAAKYHGIAVLEQHSIEVDAALMERPECRFTDGMPEAVRARGAYLLPKLILATDFGIHGDFIHSLEAAVDRYPHKADFNQPEFTLLMLQALLKAADIGNTTKPFVEAAVWAIHVMEEFWAQGDKERAAGMPVGALNDRDRIGLREAQIGFIQHVALDLFGLLACVEPELGTLLRALHENLARYQRGAPDAALK